MKSNFFNKGMAKGTLVKSEIVKWENDNTGKSGEFLSMEIEAGAGNKVNATLFPTKANPKKHIEMFNSYPVGSLVEVSGSVQERAGESKAGAKLTFRSISAFTIKPLKADSIEVATFILQGIVESIKEKSDGVVVNLSISDSYEKDGITIEKPTEFFNLEGDVLELLEDNDVVKGCSAKFKGRILNQLNFDDYGDIIGTVQMFLIEKVDNVIDPSDLDDGINEDDLPF